MRGIRIFGFCPICPKTVKPASFPWDPPDNTKPGVKTRRSAIRFSSNAPPPPLISTLGKAQRWFFALRIFFIPARLCYISRYHNEAVYQVIISRIQHAVVGTPLRCLLTSVILFTTIFIPALDIPFLMDDWYVIHNNQYLRNVDGLIHVLTQSGWTSEQFFKGFYRPITLATLWANYQLGGLTVWPYHFVNLVFHMANAIVFFFVLRMFVRKAFPKNRYRIGDWAAAFTCLVIFIHPVWASCVFYIHKRSVVLGCFFFLSAIIAFDRFLREKKTSSRMSWLLLTLLAFLFALGSRESTVTLPAALTLLTVSFGKGRLVDRWHIVGLVATWVQAIVYLSLYNVSAALVGADDVLTYLVKELTIIPQYLSLIYWPLDICIHYGDQPISSIADIKVILGLGVVILLFLTAVLAWKRGRLLSFSILWFFVTISPGTSFVPTSIPMDHVRMYLSCVPLLFVAIAYSAFFVLEKNRFVWLRKMVPILILAVLVLENFTTQKYYESSFAAWSRVIEIYPNEWRAWGGLCLQVAGMPDVPVQEKLTLCERAYELREKNVRLARMISRLRLEVGDVKGAEEIADKAYQQFGKSWVVAHIHAYLAWKQKRYSRAIDLYEKLLKNLPADADILTELAHIYRETGDKKNLQRIIEIGRTANFGRPSVDRTLDEMEAFLVSSDHSQ